VPYECFQAKDGFVNVAVTNQKQWVNFCNALGFPEIAADARFETMKNRLAHYAELRPLIERKLSSKTRSEVIACMSEVGIPAGPINTVGEILEDPQIHAREMVVELTHPSYGPLRLLGIPIKLSDTPGIVENAPPQFGEHNRQVLLGLGYSDAEIDEFVRDGVLGCA
jgi:formyl-CoA transferase/CoA:oxalate CoA-transferase